jgi:uncharacterized membrane protein YfcA
MELAALCFFSALAGFVDSIVGGGGLIQLPALLLFLSPADSAKIPAVWGTNKFASIWGTTLSVFVYSRRVKINWTSILPAGAVAFVFSFLGAYTLRTFSLFRPELLKPLIFTLMVVVAIYTAIRKNFGNIHAPKLGSQLEMLIGLAIGAAIGFYDGFFGPGTGSFLIFLFIGIFGFDFLTASASAKLVNAATNLSAVLYFGSTGNILYKYAIPMAICSCLGGFCGSNLAVLKGNNFVRVFFLTIVSLLLARLGWDMFSR